MTKISIVLAVYNGEKDVDKCLDSLRGQTMKDVEIICVDDGSTDNTVRVLKKHAAEDPRVKVFEQGENKKLLLAIKRGVKEASGEYIMFVDDDDWYEPNACERVAEIIADKHPDVVCFGAKLVEPETKVSRELRNNRLNRVASINLEYSGENTLWLEGIKYIYLWNKAVKADVAKKAYDAMPDVEMTYSSGIYACMMIHYYAKSLVSIEDKLINYNYTAGISAQNTMSAEVFEYYMRCNRISADGFGEFLKEHGTRNEQQKIQDWNNKRVLSSIQVWRDKVSKDDALEALEILFKYYDADVVIPMLQENYHKVEQSRKRYKYKKEKLEKQLEVANKKKKSVLSKLIGQ